MLLAEQRKQAAILGALLLVLAVTTLRNTVFSGGVSTPIPLDDNEEQGSATPVTASALQWQAPDPLPARFRDPMVLNLSELRRDRTTANQPIRIVTQQEGSNGDLLVKIEGSTFYLKGIAFSDENQSIITDQGILHLGDSIYGIEVMKILPNSVEFRKNDHTYHVKVGEQTQTNETDSQS